MDEYSISVWETKWIPQLTMFRFQCDIIHSPHAYPHGTMTASDMPLTTTRIRYRRNTAGLWIRLTIWIQRWMNTRAYWSTAIRTNRIWMNYWPPARNICSRSRLLSKSSARYLLPSKTGEYWQPDWVLRKTNRNVLLLSLIGKTWRYKSEENISTAKIVC